VSFAGASGFNARCFGQVSCNRFSKHNLCRTQSNSCIIRFRAFVLRQSRIFFWALRVSVVSSFASFLESPRRHGDHRALARIIQA
jgi:hypothetical protein